MICPKCGSFVEDGKRFCPDCGIDLQADGADATDSGYAATGGDSAGTDNGYAAFDGDRPESGPAGGKKKVPAALLAVIALVVVAAVAVAVLGARGGLNIPGLSAESPALSETPEAEASPEASEEVQYYAEGALNGAVAACDAQGFTLSNSEFNYYYWGEYYYILSTYGSAYFDTTKPLDEQPYDQVQSWQDYLIDASLVSMIQTKALDFEAQANGFTLPEDTQSELDATISDLQKYADEYAYDSVDAYISGSYGQGSSFDAFCKYLEGSYLSSAYSEQLYNQVEPTDQELEDYFSQNESNFEANGIFKDETKTVAVRHILIAFESDEDGNVTDEAKEAARQEAQEAYDKWVAAGKTEDAFSALAAEYSDDSGTSQEGGLCSDILPGQTVSGFDDWIFADGRKAGDCELVESSLGWHVIYFVDYGEYYWKIAAENGLRYDKVYAGIEDAVKKYAFVVDKSAISISIPTDIQASYDAAQAEAEGSAAPEASETGTGAQEGAGQVVASDEAQVSNEPQASDGAQASETDTENTAESEAPANDTAVPEATQAPAEQSAPAQ